MLTATYHRIKKASLKEIIQSIVGILAIISICFGVYLYFEIRYAKAQELDKTNQRLDRTNQRLDYKIVSDQRRDIRQEIWAIEDRMRGIPMDKWPQETIDRYRKLQEELKEFEINLTIMRTKQIKE